MSILHLDRKSVLDVALFLDNQTLVALAKTNQQNHAVLCQESQKCIPVMLEVLKNRLEAMGLDWSPLQSIAEKRLEELSAFRRKHGHCRVPVEWPENAALGQWVQSQKTQQEKLP